MSCEQTDWDFIKYTFACSPDRFTPVPDSVLHSALMSGEKMATLDSRQQVHCSIRYIYRVKLLNIVQYMAIVSSTNKIQCRETFLLNLWIIYSITCKSFKAEPFCTVINLGEHWWCSGESALLLPQCLGFKSWTNSLAS